jgi:YidC/Oxa1 family membrane protein insertase
MLDWIYIAISWILLRWHDLWNGILPGGQYLLGTNWDWILAIVFLVITVRIILFPVFVKQIRSQRAMQALAPKIKELQTKHKGDAQTLREEMMKLYQTEKVNPLMGCLPMFLQIPVFLGLFHVLRRLNPERNDANITLYTWTATQWHDASVAKLFDAPIASKFASNAGELAAMNASGVTVKIVSAVLVIIMMVTTYLTSRQMILKTGWSAEPQQRMIQKLMLYGIPISLLLSGWYFPIGVIIYWVTQNLFSYGQQYWVLHKYPPPAMAGATPVKSGAGGSGRPSAGPAKPGAKAVAPAKSTRTTPKEVGRSAAGKDGAAVGGADTVKAGGKDAVTGGTPNGVAGNGTAKAASGKAASGKPAASKAASGKDGAGKDGAGSGANGAADGRTGASAGGKDGEGQRSVLGRFTRKREPEPAPVPPTPPPSLAPKPGAKPVNRKKGPAPKKRGSKR